MSRTWFAVVCLISGVAGAQSIEGREALHATLWMQRAPEYRAVAEQKAGKTAGK